METITPIYQAVLNELKPIEIFAAITSLLCVYLTVKNNIWNWFWGLIGSVLYGYIFFRISHIYANAGLQILYFVPMQFVGWYVWMKGNPEKNDALPISALTNRERIMWCALTVLLSVALYYGLSPLVSAFRLPPPQLSPMDCFTTGLSISAQFLQTYKKFENWVLWILADLIYTFYIFPQLKMPITTFLYAVFTILAITGAISWYRQMQNEVMHKQEAATTAG
ncbi:MAG: nicotinamide mononucleotide transporter [Akkermansiaceae bacterium]|nr:nicotinamide mononucleotide transporter [Armatimonadota bacterium]